MANLNPEAAVEVQSLADRVSATLDSLVITTKPVVICGVQRKVNVGDYENIDVYCGLALPVDIDASMDTDAVMEAISDTILKGFHVTSSETLARYKLIKESKG